MGEERAHRPHAETSHHILPGRIRAGLLALLIGVACAGSDTVSPVETGGDVVSLAAPSGGDIDGVEQLVRKFEAAFAAKDAVAYGNTYAEDADFINPVGIVTSGRAGITALHAGLFAGPFKPATFTAELRDVQFLTGTIALVDVFTTLSGAAGPPPPFAVISPDGAQRARFRWLAQKLHGEWEILISYHRGWWEA